MAHVKSFTMNFGPQHPAAHGVLRLILELDGEVILRADPHVGLLHRGTEKLLENRPYLKGLPYFDRLDYVSMMAYEHAFVLTIEQSLAIPVSPTHQLVRVLFLEITRLLNHLMAVTTHALDVGALTPFLWAFEEREKMMEFYERVSGARMHAAYFRVGGVKELPDPTLLSDIYNFVKLFPARINEIDEILTNNRIWRQRLVSVAPVTALDAVSLGFSGPMLRGSGVNWDLRVSTPYECYPQLDFSVPVGEFGDCFDRFLVRMEEMRQSCLLIQQVLELLPTDPVVFSSSSNTQMENLIEHFKFYSGQSYYITPGTSSYVSVEAPKGEFGCFLLANGYEPWRVRLRAPGFVHLSALDYMVSDHMVSDLVTVIGTQDIVFGEVDR